jgi:hypothetical protein
MVCEEASSPFDEGDDRVQGSLCRFQVLWTAPRHRELVTHELLVPSISFSFPVILQVKSTVDKDHAFDTRFLLRVVCGRAFCSAAGHFLYYACYTLSSVLNRRSRLYYSSHVFHAVARLDLPTWDDPAVSSQIAALFPSSPLTVSWVVILTFVNTVSAVVRLCSQSAILFGVLRGQKDGFSFALLTFSSNLASYLNYSTTYPLSRSKAPFTLTFIFCM